MDTETVTVTFKASPIPPVSGDLPVAQGIGDLFPSLGALADMADAVSSIHDLVYFSSLVNVGFAVLNVGILTLLFLRVRA